MSSETPITTTSTINITTLNQHKGSETVPVTVLSDAAVEYNELGKQIHATLFSEFSTEFSDAANMIEKAEDNDDKLHVIAQFAHFWYGKLPPYVDGVPTPPIIQVTQQICKQFIDICVTQAAVYGFSPEQFAEYIAKSTIGADQVGDNKDNENEVKSNYKTANKPKESTSSAKWRRHQSRRLEKK